MCTLLLLGNLLLSQNIGNSVWMCGRQAANTTVLVIYLMSTSHLGILALLSARTAVHGMIVKLTPNYPFCVRKCGECREKPWRCHALQTQTDFIHRSEVRISRQNILLHVFSISDSVWGVVSWPQFVKYFYISILTISFLLN